MIPIQDFGPGVTLTTDYIASLARAIQELQSLAITQVHAPLQRQGSTLFARVGLVGFWAQIVAAGETAGTYEFQEIRLDADGEFELVTAGRGTVEGELAREANDSAAVPDGAFAWVWQAIDAAGVRQYRFTAMLGGTAATPYDLDPTNLQDETADAKTWTRATPPADTDGVTWSGPRVVYSTTDKAYYRFYRVVTTDSQGAVAAVSAETKVQITDLVPCVAAE